MNINLGDRVVMKKKHPCGNNVFIVSRIGIDFKLRCEGCGHEVMLPRKSAEKAIKQILAADEKRQ